MKRFFKYQMNWYSGMVSLQFRVIEFSGNLDFLAGLSSVGWAARRREIEVISVSATIAATMLESELAFQ